MVKYGIIGCGSRSTCLSNLIKKRYRQSVLMGIYDNDMDVINKKKENKNNLYTHDIDEFCSRDMSFVIIGSMNYLHYEHFLKIYNSGKKIFCEKPIVITENELAKLESFDNISNGSVVGTGFVLRYSSFYSKIKEIIDNNQIGKVVHMNIQENLHIGHGAFINQNWRRKKSLSGGHIVEKGIHIIDLINWYLNAMPIHVTARGNINNWTNDNRVCGEQLKKKYNDPSLYDKYKVYEHMDPYDTSDRDIEDTISTILEYPGTLVSFSMTSYAPNSKRVFDIIGTMGKLEAIWEHKTACIKIIHTGYGKKDTSGNPCISSQITYEDMGCHGNGDDSIIDSLLKFATHNIPMKPSFQQALNANKVAIMLEKSLITGTTISL